MFKSDSLFPWQVTKFSKRDKLVELLKVVGSNRTMVFVETKKNCDFIATHLNSGKLLT